MARYELVVFDWDGTVMDTTGLIAEGMVKTAREMGLTAPTMEAARGVIGIDWRRALGILCPEMPLARYEEFVTRYKEWYIPREGAIRLYDGIDALFDELLAKGVRLAVATGKSRAGLDRVLAQTGLTEKFEHTVTADECAPKPSPEMLEEIALMTAVDAKRIVMVGDTTHDLAMARAFGCDAVAMTYGAGRRADLEALSPVALCADVRELAQVLLKD